MKSLTSSLRSLDKPWRQAHKKCVKPNHRKATNAQTSQISTICKFTFLVYLSLIVAQSLIFYALALPYNSTADPNVYVVNPNIDDDDFKTSKARRTIHVNENTPINSTLSDIHVQDHVYPNEPITYGIVGGPDNSSFSLRAVNNENKRELVNLINFDYESPKKTYQILIRATSLYMRFEQIIDIVVTDENDNKPQLEDFSIVVNNYKNHFPAAPIGRIPATDADISDQLRFRIISGNNAQYIAVNETSGEIQLSPGLNSNVPMKAVFEVAVSDGQNEIVAQCVLVVNLITDAMLQNSVVLKLGGTSKEEFLNKKLETFLKSLAITLMCPNTINIVVFNVEESYGDSLPLDSMQQYRYFQPTIHSNMSLNVSFSVRSPDNRDVESFLSSQHIEERIYLDRPNLMHRLGLYIAPFQDNLCVQEPCRNYQECQAIYRFGEASRHFIATKNILFRPIRAIQSFACSCPATFTGMTHRSECDLQINPCFSNPCLNGGTCYRHEAGYSCECKLEFLGKRCELSFANSTCQSHALSIVGQERYQSSLCAGKSKCVNLNKPLFQSQKIVLSSNLIGGFKCQDCPNSAWSNDLCQLRARSFNRSSYVTLPSLRRRHRFHIMLQFATIQSDSLIFYNGRYNDKHDFVSLEIIDSFLKFTYSLGFGSNYVSLNTIPVSDGSWHKVAIDYNSGNVTIIVDDCDPVIDEALSKNQGSFKKCSNTTIFDPSRSRYRSLDLSSPLIIGTLPTLPLTEFQITTANGFAGCINDLYIDHQLVDMHSVIQEYNTHPGCPEKRSFCHQTSCSGHKCQDAWGQVKCSCSEEYLGKSCETFIVNEKVRRFNGNSYLTFAPIENTITSPWFISLYFKTINPNGVLMKISLDPDATLLLELWNGGLKFSSKTHNMTFTKVSLDDGEWHHVEMSLTIDYAQLLIDHNPNLSAHSGDFTTFINSVVKSITIGASLTRPIETSGESTDFMANLPESDYTGIYAFNNTSSQSFNGCIYRVNISDNIELWLQHTPNDERNVERGCIIPDVCDSNPSLCPANSKCIRKGMDRWKCVCNPGFVGDKCIPICDLNLCQGENSRCYPSAVTIEGTNDIVNVPSSTSGYKCICEPNRMGKNCEHQLSAKCPSNWWGSPVAGGQASICGPCDCDESRGFDGDCDKTTGQCLCKVNHYQPEGSDYCLPCDCYEVGSLGTACNQTSGQCKCRSGVVGRRCDTCTSPLAEVTRRGCEVIYDACPKTFSDGIWWEKTQLAKLATQACPPLTSDGTATRFCDKTEGWQKPNLFDCISHTLRDLYTQYLMFENDKFQLNFNLAMKTAASLRLALNETISNPASQLYGSDMYISFRLIHHLIQYELRQSGLNMTHKQDRMYIRNLVESTNYILDPAYAENWQEISIRSPNGGAEHLLKLFDVYAKILIDNQIDTYGQPFEISTKYFTFGMDTISTDQLWDVDRATSFNSASSSPPYASDIISSYSNPSSNMIPPLISNVDGRFNLDGSSIYLDQSLGRDSSPAVVIPKYNNYISNNHPEDEVAKVLIPLKTIGVKTFRELQEVITTPPYHARARAKREVDAVNTDLKYMKHAPALVAYSIFKTIGPLLPSQHDNTVQHRFGGTATTHSPVVWLTVKSTNGSDFLSRNLQPKFNYMLKLSETTGRTRPQCAVWNFFSNPPTGVKNSSSSHPPKIKGRFTTKGCEIRGVHPNHRLRLKYDYINCSCDHLGAVTVLMDSANYDYLTDESNVKDMTITICLSISIFITTIGLLILTCGHSIKSNSNSINKNLLIVLIIIEILLLYTIASRGAINQREYHCKLIAIFLHYFSICLFSWMLVNVIHLFRMLTEVRDINHGPMKFYHIIGYAIPGFFVSIAVGLRIEHFGNYLFCWVSIHEPIIWSMFGPISCISLLIGTLFAMAFYKSFSIKADSSAESILKSYMFTNIIKTPIIGIYWITAVYAVNEALVDYVYLFPAVTLIKSIILFILLCIVDKHIRYNLYVNWLRFRGENIPIINNQGPWMAPMMIDPATLGKHTSFTTQPGNQLTTPGFQSSCTDIFNNGLALSIASTTSQSSATGTSSSAYQYQRRVNDEGHGGKSGYGRSRGKHRRRSHSHRKSHHKHHHRHGHHHHHHHHYHRSRHGHHHHQDYEENNDHYQRNDDSYTALNEAKNQHENYELASSHSSDDFSTLPKKLSHRRRASRSGGGTSDDEKSGDKPKSHKLKHCEQLESGVDNLSATFIETEEKAHEKHQTVPMQLDNNASSIRQDSDNSNDESRGAGPII